MGEFFTDEKDVYRVKFQDGQWVDLKTDLTQEDTDYIMSQMMTTRAVTNGGEPKAELELKLGKMAAMERSIVAWSFPAPVNKDNISRLKSRYRAIILKEIDRLSQESASFLPASGKAST